MRRASVDLPAPLGPRMRMRFGTTSGLDTIAIENDSQAVRKHDLADNDRNGSTALLSPCPLSCPVFSASVNSVDQCLSDECALFPQ